MALYKSDFINELYSRGFVHQTTDISNIDKKMSKNKITAYIGFDATADSLHVGSLIPIMLLSWLQKLSFYSDFNVRFFNVDMASIGDIFLNKIPNILCHGRLE